MTVYKVVWLNDQGFVQERNFDNATSAASFAVTIDGWYRILSVATSQTVTDITT